MKRIIAKIISGTFFGLGLTLLSLFLIRAFIVDWKSTLIALGIIAFWVFTIWALEELSHD